MKNYICILQLRQHDEIFCELGEVVVIFRNINNPNYPLYARKTNNEVFGITGEAFMKCFKQVKSNVILHPTYLNPVVKQNQIYPVLTLEQMYQQHDFLIKFKYPLVNKNSV